MSNGTQTYLTLLLLSLQDNIVTVLCDALYVSPLVHKTHSYVQSVTVFSALHNSKEDQVLLNCNYTPALFHIITMFVPVMELVLFQIQKYSKLSLIKRSPYNVQRE